MKRLICLLTAILVLAVLSSTAQIINAAVMDTTDVQRSGKVTISGYLDLYYAYDFNKPATGDRPYFVSMARHNEVTVNLAYLDVKYSSSRLRGRFVPGFGTYMNANYLAEPGTLRNLVEASAGFRLSRKKEIWMDAGIFGSPYTNESAISKDHLAYTRSFAPEYVPYYLSGVKISYALSPKVNAYAYLLNGWQQIADVNQSKSLGTQLEIRPNDSWLLNWNTYVGNEQSTAAPDFRMRYFSDVYFIYSKTRFTATGCAYYGIQDRIGRKSHWWQANIIGRYQVTERSSVTGRFEYFDDPESVQIKSITNTTGFRSYSSSLGLNYHVAANVMVRLEGRTFFSSKEVYSRANTPVRTSNLITSNLTMWF